MTRVDEGPDVERIAELERKVERLGGQGPWRFFFQYLFSPLLLLAVGTVVNWRIEAGRAELQRLAAAREMIPVLFDGNPEMAFATQRVLARTVDRMLAEELSALVNSYYTAKVAEHIAAGDTASASIIVAAAENVGGAAAARLIEELPADTRVGIQDFSSRSKAAAYFERIGFEQLLSGDVTGAAASFEEAERQYPGYHQVYELGRLMRARETPSLPQATLMSTVRDGYLYGAPSDVSNRVRELARTP